MGCLGEGSWGCYLLVLNLREIVVQSLFIDGISFGLSHTGDIETERFLIKVNLENVSWSP